MNDTRLFAFEDDFVATLRCIPMAVRFKLDRSMIKLTLRQWSRMDRSERALLLSTPCDSEDEVRAYQIVLRDLITKRTGEAATVLTEAPRPLWSVTDSTPDIVASFAQSRQVDPPSDEAWARLSELERFTLLKLTRDNHDNVNFVPAMREFGLA